MAPSTSPSGNAVYVDGDVVIRASGKATFSDSVVLRNGGRLFIQDASEVEFMAGVPSSATQPVLVYQGASGRVSFDAGTLKGSGDKVLFSASARSNFPTRPRAMRQHVWC
jgi:hypothetical protein